MKNRRTTSRKGLHASVFAIFILFVWMAVVAFPAQWNRSVAAVSPVLEVEEQPFKLGLDLQGGVHLVYEADMSAINPEDRVGALDGVRDVIERRVNAFGVSEPLVQTNISGDSYRVIVELAGVFDVGEAVDLIGETPILEFKVPVEDLEAQTELTPEQEVEIELAQELEREQALEVLDRALAGEDFATLVEEASVSRRSADDGYYGFITEDDGTFGELALELARYDVGIVDGLYEADSSLHVINYLGSEVEELVDVSHILICHNDSERCDGGGKTKVEAKLIAEEIARTVTASTFAEVAKERSEGPSAADGGSLGTVSSGMMVADFEAAYLALTDGEISDVVETEFGYHIIYREDSSEETRYEIAHIELPWTTASDVLEVDPWENTELSGKDVKRAAVAFDQATGAPNVLLTFNAEGGQLFEDLTKEYQGNVIGIFLDGEAISTPVVQSVIYGGEATITGSFTITEAKLLAQRLNAGALPVSIELLSQQTVGPTLGAISLEKSVQAAVIGLAALVTFMVLYYRLSGVFAVLSLMFYTVINLALYKWLGVTMTLAGIAGFVLSLGMAVDANVLIFERLKEELKSGRDLPTAIDEGFRRAWTSIRDGNITTLIAAAVLFTMSTSFIKGFALTLALGILVSMATAVLVTRVLLKWVSLWQATHKKWLFGVKE